MNKFWFMFRGLCFERVKIKDMTGLVLLSFRIKIFGGSEEPPPPRLPLSHQLPPNFLY